MAKRDELMAVQAARKANMRLDVLYPLLRAGQIDARQVDGRWRVSASSLDDYIKRRAERQRKRQVGQGL